MVRLDAAGKAVWLFKCDCGNSHEARSNAVRSGGTVSCGCVHLEKLRAQHRTHGQSKTREYKIWKGMKKRCYNEAEKAFPSYGGRGICVCDRWLDSFPNFIDDMGRAPSNIHSIDRIDNNGNYEPGNCRWATPTVQACNTRKSARVQVAGALVSMPQAAHDAGMDPRLVRSRMQKHGWSADDALGLEPRPTRWKERINFRGESLTIAEIAKQIGLPWRVLHRRVRESGWDIERAVSTPLSANGGRFPSRAGSD